MKTLHLKDKAQKDYLVSKILYLFFFVTFICNSQVVKLNDDYLIVKKFINSGEDEETTINIKNDNTYIIDLIEQLKKVEQTKNKHTIDSLKIFLGIKKSAFTQSSDHYINSNDKGLDSVFSIKEYDFLLSQKHKGYWDKKIISNFNQKEKNNNYREIFFSKPIYTRNGKWALVYKHRETSSFVLILKKENDIWLEYKTINNLIISPKVKLISTKN